MTRGCRAADVSKRGRVIGSCLFLIVGVMIALMALAPGRSTTVGALHRDAGSTVACDLDGQATTLTATVTLGRLMFVGASYSMGLGATRRNDGFTYQLAATLHQGFAVDAVSGTGYQNPGPRHQGTFGQRIARDSGPAPRLLVMQGGRDDAAYPVSREYSAVVATIHTAQLRFPRARIVLLGPTPALLPVRPAILRIRDAIARAAQATGTAFVDPIAEQWITTANQHEYVGRVPGHPNDAGYTYISSQLRGELPETLGRSSEPASNCPVVAPRHLGGA